MAWQLMSLSLIRKNMALSLKIVMTSDKLICSVEGHYFSSTFERIMVKDINSPSTLNMPFIVVDAWYLNNSLISAAEACLTRLRDMSAMEPSMTGTRYEKPSNLPFKEGSTSPIALAAPVVVGMMDWVAARALR